MDFFARQDAARRRTGLLVFYYAVAVLLIVAGIYIAAIATFIGTSRHAEDAYGVRVTQSEVVFWNPQILAGVTGAVLIIVLAGSMYKISQLSSGGEAVARMMDGRPVTPDTTDPDERKLLNIVEEMAIASGTPMPQVFVIDGESGINAFAAGYSPSSAVVAVTRGCVRLLNRDELQGVIAHEFSHILNGDMRLNIRLIGILHGILVISIVGYYLMRIGFAGGGRSRSSKKGGALPVAIFGLIVMAIGYIGILFGNLIKSAVSRQREFLADASAVQFTRNPSGIGNALKKIGGHATGSHLANAHASEASHLLFANGLRSAWLGLFATHPPLTARIARIDPAFDGTFITPSPPREPVASRAEPPPLPEEDEMFSVIPAVLVATAGTVSPAHLQHARQVLEGIPAPLQQQAHDPFGARAVVYVLLLATDSTIRTQQLQRLAERADAKVYETTLALVSSIANLGAAQRLPLAEICLPALKALSPDQYAAFRACTQSLIEADEEIDLFEYTLQHMFKRRLDPIHGKGSPRVRVRYTHIPQVLDDATQLLSALAAWGADTEAAADAAYDAGTRELLLGRRFQRQPPTACGLDAIDTSLNALAQASGELKRRILTACIACISADGEIRREESELIRAIGDALDVPLPPLLPQ